MITRLQKSMFALAALLLPVTAAQATVSLQFSTTAIYATNFANSNDVGGETLTWGIIVDAAGNGFTPAYSADGISYTAGTTAQHLIGENNTASDDVLFLSTFTMNITGTQNVDGSVQGLNRITNINLIPFGSGVDPGDSFMLVWFDTTYGGGSPATAPQAPQRWGSYMNSNFLLPPDGATINFAAGYGIFQGADPLKTMNNTFTPEPSTALLSLLGAPGLVRRRR